MPGRTISQIYKSGEEHFIKRLREARDLDEQRVHKLRVDIKNQRVLLELLRVVSGKKRAGKPVLKQLEPVFKHAGQIRTNGLNLSLSQPYRSQVLLKFRQHLRLRQQQARIDFLQTLKKFDHEGFRRKSKKARAEFKAIKKKKFVRTAEEYLRLLFSQVRAGIFDISDDDRLHDIRKKLKAIRNIGHLLEDIDPGFALKDELEKISVTYEKIGQWHDTQELIDAIEKYVADTGDPIALEKTTPLIIALKKKCLYNKKKIEHMLKADLLMPDPADLKFVA